MNNKLLFPLAFCLSSLLSAAKGQTGYKRVAVAYARSLKKKCRHAQKQGLRGVMYWDYNDDDAQGSLRKCVWKTMR